MIAAVRKTREFLVEHSGAKCHQTDAHAFVVERQHESLDEPNASVLANGAEAGCERVAVIRALGRTATTMAKNPVMSERP